MLVLCTVVDILFIATLHTFLVGLIEMAMGNSFWETFTAFDCNEGEDFVRLGIRFLIGVWVTYKMPLSSNQWRDRWLTWKDRGATTGKSTGIV
jgi:hypothetical protein